MTQDKIDVEIIGKTLLVDGRPVADFDFLDQMKVQAVVMDGDNIIVSFDNRERFLNDTRINRNVAAFGRKGSLIWRIQECPFNSDHVSRPYDTIRIDDQGRLIVGNKNGGEYVVDRSTGEVTPHAVRYGGRPW